MPLSAPPPPPPLLLTKRLTSFLHANLSSQLHTAALTTPAGKILAHASAEPASTLRRQCAVAASLWALHAPETSQFSDSVETALPSSHGSRAGDAKASAITVQLDSGAVFILRHLRCGMLFVCIGGSEGAGAGRPLPHGLVASSADAGSAHVTTSPPFGSPSEAASILSAGTTGAATVTSHTTTGSTVAGMSPAMVLAMRRQVEELAKWLDERLGTLSVPEEGIGLNPGNSDLR